MSKGADRLLSEIVASLVDAYGREGVQQALDKAARVPRVADERLGQSFKASGSQPRLPLEQKKRTRQISARDLIDRQAVSQAKKVYVQQIADRFDQRQFLPSSADAREFLILSGKKPKAIKDRADAFRQVLAVLLQLPAERLAGIAGSESHAGPSNLSLISDAIGDVGRERRSRETS